MLADALYEYFETHIAALPKLLRYALTLTGVMHVNFA